MRLRARHRATGGRGTSLAPSRPTVIVPCTGTRSVSSGGGVAKSLSRTNSVKILVEAGPTAEALGPPAAPAAPAFRLTPWVREDGAEHRAAVLSRYVRTGFDHDGAAAGGGVGRAVNARTRVRLRR
jgi:hypothetical protein